MELNLRESDKYSIEGKIVDVNDKSSTLTISVTSPFEREIKFQCSSAYYNLLHPPVTSKYNWIDWVAGGEHPSVCEASVYYNTSHKCFYRKESGRESEWERADFEDIYNDDGADLFVKHVGMPEKYQFFLFKYKPILHKGQLCHFSAYAIDRTDRNTHSVHGKKIKRHPEDYTWIYDPDTFYGEKWDAESIDGLVKEIRPSRDCVEQLFKFYKDDDRITESIDDLVREILPSRECLEESLKRHDAADAELKRKEWKEKLERIKSAPEHFQNWLAKYNQIWYFFATFLAGALGTLIATLIINYFRSK